MRKPSKEFITRLISKLKEGEMEFIRPRRTMKLALAAITRSNTMPSRIKEMTWQSLSKIDVFYHSVWELRESLKQLLEEVDRDA